MGHFTYSLILCIYFSDTSTIRTAAILHVRQRRLPSNTRHAIPPNWQPSSRDGLDKWSYIFVLFWLWVWWYYLAEVAVLLSSNTLRDISLKFVGATSQSFFTALAASCATRCSDKSLRACWRMSVNVIWFWATCYRDKILLWRQIFTKVSSTLEIICHCDGMLQLVA